MDRSEALIQHRLRTEFPFFAETFLRIKTKDGEVVPFKFNKAQMRLWRLMKDLDSKGKPIRIIILKARQLGMSTFVQGYLFWKSVSSPGTNGLVVSHDEDSAIELFSKQEMMFRLLPEEYYSQLQAIKDAKKQGKKLAFAGDLNTLLYVDTAGKATIGRGQTYQFVHLSEFAYYPKPREIMRGLSQSVPKKAGTVMIIESTADGMGNAFHKMWERSSKGESEWAPLFIPWYEDDDYRMLPPKGFKLTRDEKKIKRKYKLDDDQMYWRRYVIETDFDGDVEAFEQENPADPKEPFLISGRPYFGKSNLHEYRRKTKDPLKQGIFEVKRKKPVFTEQEDGQWRIFKKPVASRHYVIGADVAGGSARDYSAAHVLDLETLEQVASFRGKLDPYQFAYQLKWAGLAYNTALLAVERNGEGRACVLKLSNDMMYPRMYYPQTEESWSGGIEKQWGWVTSSRTRPTILSQLKELMSERDIIIHDDRTVTELESFVTVDTSKIATAANGAYDDMVMALAIAGSSSVREQASAMAKVGKRKKRQPRVSSVTGY